MKKTMQQMSRCNEATAQYKAFYYVREVTYQSDRKVH